MIIQIHSRPTQTHRAAVTLTVTVTLPYRSVHVPVVHVPVVLDLDLYVVLPADNRKGTTVHLLAHVPYVCMTISCTCSHVLNPYTQTVLYCRIRLCGGWHTEMPVYRTGSSSRTYHSVFIVQYSVGPGPAERASRFGPALSSASAQPFLPSFCSASSEAKEARSVLLGCCSATRPPVRRAGQVLREDPHGLVLSPIHLNGQNDEFEEGESPTKPTER